MKTNTDRAPNRRAGFSMIEVLVAASILVVIVMMLAMLFQQTSLAWRTGVKRADAYMQIRSAIGAIQRDASQAIDERTIPEELRAELGGSQQFGGSLAFFTLTGTGADPAMRSLKFITYGANGRRTEKGLEGGGGTVSDSSNVSDFVRRASSQNQSSTSSLKFDAKMGPDSHGLPLYITIDAQVITSGFNLEIGAGSAGPDKTWNTKDDIKTWVDGGN